MSKETRKQLFHLVILVLGISLTYYVSRRGARSDQIITNTQDIAVHDVRIDEVEQRQDKHVTKEYFDLGMQGLKDLINKE